MGVFGPTSRRRVVTGFLVMRIYRLLVRCFTELLAHTLTTCPSLTSLRVVLLFVRVVSVYTVSPSSPGSSPTRCRSNVCIGVTKLAALDLVLRRSALGRLIMRVRRSKRCSSARRIGYLRVRAGSRNRMVLRAAGWIHARYCRLGT